MNWVDASENEMVNLDQVVKATRSEDGLNTVIHTSFAEYSIPIMYDTFRAITIMRKQIEDSRSESHNKLLQRVLKSQFTPVP